MSPTSSTPSIVSDLFLHLSRICRSLVIPVPEGRTVTALGSGSSAVVTWSSPSLQGQWLPNADQQTCSQTLRRLVYHQQMGLSSKLHLKTLLGTFTVVSQTSRTAVWTTDCESFEVSSTGVFYQTSSICVIENN